MKSNKLTVKNELKSNDFINLLTIPEINYSNMSDHSNMSLNNHSILSQKVFKSILQDHSHLEYIPEFTTIESIKSIEPIQKNVLLDTSENLFELDSADKDSPSIGLRILEYLQDLWSYAIEPQIDRVFEQIVTTAVKIIERVFNKELAIGWQEPINYALYAGVEIIDNVINDKLPYELATPIIQIIHSVEHNIEIALDDYSSLSYSSLSGSTSWEKPFD